MNDSPYFCIFSHVVLCSTPCNININWQKNKVGKKKFIDAQWVYWLHRQREGCLGAIEPIVRLVAQEANAVSTFKAYKKKHHDDGEDHFF